MNRISICTVLFLLTSTAAAQEETLDVVNVDAVAVGSTDIARVNAAQCMSTTDVILDVESPTTTTQADLWFGNGANCSDTTQRHVTDGQCEWVSHVVDIEDATFAVSLQNIVASLPSVCTGESTIKVYALYTTITEDRGDVSAWGVFSILVDGNVPDAPEIATEYRNLSGDSEVTVRWEPINESMTSFEVLPGGECGSDSFDPNAAPIATSAVLSQNTTLSPLDDLGLLTEGTPAQTSAAVYVVATDLAGNRSGPSAEVCISRVPVAGFCEVFNHLGGADCGESGCSVAAPGSGSSGAPLMFVLFALLWTRRP